MDTSILRAWADEVDRELFGGAGLMKGIVNRCEDYNSLEYVVRCIYDELELLSVSPDDRVASKVSDNSDWLMDRLGGLIDRLGAAT